jgi:hypothetical protein
VYKIQRRYKVKYRSLSTYWMPWMQRWGSRIIVLSIHDIGARRDLVVHATHRLIYPRKIFGTGCRVSWGEWRGAYLGGYGKSRFHRSLNPETSSSKRIAIPATLTFWHPSFTFKF